MAWKFIHSPRTFLVLYLSLSNTFKLRSSYQVNPGILKKRHSVNKNTLILRSGGDRHDVDTVKSEPVEPCKMESDLKNNGDISQAHVQ